MPTPKSPGDTQSKIEDFFSAETKAIPHGGKTFNDAKDADKGETLFEEGLRASSRSSERE